MGRQVRLDVANMACIRMRALPAGSKDGGGTSVHVRDQVSVKFNNYTQAQISKPCGQASRDPRMQRGHATPDYKPWWYDMYCTNYTPVVLAIDLQCKA